MFDLRNRRVCHNELYDIYFSRKQRAKCGPAADRLKPMIHGPICRIRHVGYDKIWGCLIVYHPLKHHATPSDNVVRKIGRVQFSSDSNQLCRMDKPIKWQVSVHVVMFMFCVYVHVLI